MNAFNVDKETLVNTQLKWVLIASKQNGKKMKIIM